MNFFNIPDYNKYINNYLPDSNIAIEISEGYFKWNAAFKSLTLNIPEVKNNFTLENINFKIYKGEKIIIYGGYKFLFI